MSDQIKPLTITIMPGDAAIVVRSDGSNELYLSDTDKPNEASMIVACLAHILINDEAMEKLAGDVDLDQLLAELDALDESDDSESVSEPTIKIKKVLN